MKRTKPTDSSVLRFIGSELSACRRERGLSQETLAELARISADSVGRIERGHRDFGMLAISKLYLLLECGGIDVTEEGFLPLRDRAAGARIRRETAGFRPPHMLGAMGLAVRDERVAKGLSLARLAVLAGVHANTVWNFEKGLVVPGICTYFRLLRSLDIDRVTVEKGILVFHNK
jgi:transcriptional regulator with XRE-family HTH domain